MEDLSNFDAVNYLHGAYSQMYVLNNYVRNKKREEVRLHRWYVKLKNGEFEYELIDGKPFLILPRMDQNRVSRSKKGKTLMCMFCGHEHTHGTASGHRAPHCSLGSILLHFIKHKDGTILKQSDGYILKDYLF